MASAASQRIGPCSRFGPTWCTCFPSDISHKNPSRRTTLSRYDGYGLLTQVNRPRPPSFPVTLRAGQFMDSRPDPSDAPSEIIGLIMEAETWRQLCGAWDRMYPSDPVWGEDENEE